MKKSLAVTLLTICLVIVPTLVAGFFCRLEALERTACANSLSSQSGSRLSSEEERSESVNDGVQSQADLPSEAEEQEWTDSQLYSTDYLAEEAALYDFVEYYMNLAFSELGEPQNADGWTKYGAYFGDGYAM